MTFDKMLPAVVREVFAWVDRLLALQGCVLPTIRPFSYRPQAWDLAGTFPPLTACARRRTTKPLRGRPDRVTMRPAIAPCASLNTRQRPSPLPTDSLGNKGFG